MLEMDIERKIAKMETQIAELSTLQEARKEFCSERHIKLDSDISVVFERIEKLSVVMKTDFEKINRRINYLLYVMISSLVALVINIIRMNQFS